MVSVRLNGEDSSIQSGGLTKFTDLVELIKASIDPDHMITVIRIDGKELGDQEWMSTIPQLGTSIIEIETDTPERFVTERFSSAADVVRNCYMGFRDARKEFQNGSMNEGNRHLMRGVEIMRAFFDWYGSLLELVPPHRKSTYDIDVHVRELSEVCKKICQQQLYQSWWALGETIQKELEPKLDKLEDHCRRFRASV
jgi:hypothetical protein